MRFHRLARQVVALAAFVLPCVCARAQDTLPEGTSGTVLSVPASGFTSAAHTLRDLDLGLGTAPDPFVVDDASGSLLRFERGFFAPNVVTFGAHVPGPDAQLRRCRAFTIEPAGPTTVMVVRLFVSRAHAGNAVTFELRSGATILAAPSFTIPPGTATFNLWAQLGSPVAFDRVVVSSSGPVDGGAFSAALEGVAHFIGDFAPICSGNSVFHVPCPCGNATGTIDAEGCAHSLGFGARLRGAGTASLSNDTFQLLCAQTPNTTVLFLQSTTYSISGTLLGDGVNCLGGAVVRLGVSTATSNSVLTPVAGELPLSVRGALTAPGQVFYQAWHRNAAAFCTSDTFNLSDAWAVNWTL